MRLPHAGNLEGVISNGAICDGSLNLGEAIEWLQGRSEVNPPSGIFAGVFARAKTP